MGFVKEFKEFAMKGNVIDLAVAVIIGGAFQKIVSSLVKDIIMPCVGMLMGGVSFADLNTTIGEAVIKYGIFIQAIVDFIIVAMAIFCAVKMINASKKKEEEKPAAPAAPPEDIQLLREIRDSLKK